MKKVYFLLMTIVLIFILSIQVNGSPGTEFTTNIYYDLDFNNPDFGYFGGLGISVLRSSPLNQSLRMYYGINSGFTGLGLNLLADLGVGMKFDINSYLNIEPIILINGGVNLFPKDGSPSVAGGASGLIRLNTEASYGNYNPDSGRNEVYGTIKLHFTTGLKYLYLGQNYQNIFIPVEVGIIF